MLNQYKITVNHILVSKLAKEMAPWKKTRERKIGGQEGGEPRSQRSWVVITYRFQVFKFVKQETKGYCKQKNVLITSIKADMSLVASRSPSSEQTNWWNVNCTTACLVFASKL